MKIIEFKNTVYKQDDTWYYIKLSKEYHDGLSYVKIKKNKIKNILTYWQICSMSKNPFIQSPDRKNFYDNKPEDWNVWQV